MKELFLVKPSKAYEKSFIKYVLSYEFTEDEYYFNKYKKAIENFDGYIEDLEEALIKAGSEYDVITSTFWLIYNEEVCGVVRVRHEEVDTAGHIGYDISPLYRNKGFGSVILKLALVEAKKIGLNEVIVTCSIDNDFSRKIIEKNNGKLLGTVYDDEDKEYLYKYIIK